MRIPEIKAENYFYRLLHPDNFCKRVLKKHIWTSPELEKLILVKFVRDFSGQCKFVSNDEFLYNFSFCFVSFLFNGMRPKTKVEYRKKIVVSYKVP